MNVRLAGALFSLLPCVGVGTLGHADDPPERVARVSRLSGELALQSAGSAASDPAFLNWPVAAGDRLVTSPEARAELSFGTGAASLGGSTDLTVTGLDQNAVQLQVNSGAAVIHVRELRNGEAFAVQIPNSTARLLQPGDYRFTVAGDGNVKVLVQTGEAQVETGIANFQQLAGEEAEIGADRIVNIVRSDAAGNAARSKPSPARKVTRASTVNHVARGLVGYEDLDGYGAWQWSPEYGMVWEPKQVSPEWAPYRYGQWIWKAPWGWTWVDDAPWGFAPFHYGRWVQLSKRWYWIPGPRQISPVYSPALVSWTSDPADATTIGWRPLGPRETYIPPYPASELHAQRLNLFANVRTHAALTAGSAGVSSPPAVAWIQRAALADHPPLLR